MQTLTRTGHAGQAIIQAANESQCDLLVLGRSGYSEVWGRFMGSTADKVSRHVPCSVLIVPSSVPGADMFNCLLRLPHPAAVP